MNATTSPSRKRWLWLAIALALVLLVVFWMFIKTPAAADDGAPAADAGPKPSLTVTVALPERSSLPIRLQANGNITAWQEASVGAELNGLRLASVNVNVGDVVRKGQVLAEFVRETTQADSLQSRASLMQAEASFENAKADADRARSIQDTGALSASQVAQYLTQEKVARAGLHQRGGDAGVEIGLIQADAALASVLPIVTVVATDPVAGETGPNTGTLTVSRTGPATAALTEAKMLEQLSARDSLTGLDSRGHWLAQAEALLAAHQQTCELAVVGDRLVGQDDEAPAVRLAPDFGVVAHQGQHLDLVAHLDRQRMRYRRGGFAIQAELFLQLGAEGLHPGPVALDEDEAAGEAGFLIHRRDVGGGGIGDILDDGGIEPFRSDHRD